jgi:hypothetical protein
LDLLPPHTVRIKPDRFNARALAVNAFIENKPLAIWNAIFEWNRPWQEKMKGSKSS